MTQPDILITRQVGFDVVPFKVESGTVDGQDFLEISPGRSDIAGLAYEALGMGLKVTLDGKWIEIRDGIMSHVV